MICNFILSAHEVLAQKLATWTWSITWTCTFRYIYWV